MLPYRTANVGRAAALIVTKCLKERERRRQLERAEEARRLRGDTVRVRREYSGPDGGEAWEEQGSDGGSGLYVAIVVGSLFFAFFLLVFGMPWQASVSALGVGAAAVAAAALYRMKIDEARGKVAAESDRYAAIVRLNSAIPFDYPDACYEFVHHCTSKREFDCFDADAFFENVLTSIAGEVEDVGGRLRLNIARWDYYIDQISSIPPTFSSGICGRVESEMCAAAMRKMPPTCAEASVEVVYVSPAGKNEYRETYSLGGDMDEVKIPRHSRGLLLPL